MVNVSGPTPSVRWLDADSFERAHTHHRSTGKTFNQCSVSIHPRYDALIFPINWWFWTLGCTLVYACWCNRPEREDPVRDLKDLHAFICGLEDRGSNPNFLPGLDIPGIFHWYIQHWMCAIPVRNKLLSMCYALLNPFGATTSLGCAIELLATDRCSRLDVCYFRTTPRTNPRIRRNRKATAK